MRFPAIASPARRVRGRQRRNRAMLPRLRSRSRLQRYGDGTRSARAHRILLRRRRGHSLRVSPSCAELIPALAEIVANISIAGISSPGRASSSGDECWSHISTRGREPSPNARRPSSRSERACANTPSTRSSCTNHRVVSDSRSREPESRRSRDSRTEVSLPPANRPYTSRSDQRAEDSVPQR